MAATGPATAQVLLVCQLLGVDTRLEVQGLRAQPRTCRTGNCLMNYFVGSVQSLLGKQWQSRKRIRHVLLQLLREGLL